MSLCTRSGTRGPKMKSLLSIFAVSLLVCSQSVYGRDAAGKSQTSVPLNACPATAPAGSVLVLSNTSGVDLNPYVHECYSITDRNWIKAMPKEAKEPVLARGQAQIMFNILPNGKVKRHDIVLEASSGNAALDHAAWKAIRKSKYPPIPKGFKGPYLRLLFCFRYNMQSPQHGDDGDKTP